jgi:hypothetical protein
VQRLTASSTPAARAYHPVMAWVSRWEASVIRRAFTAVPATLRRSAAAAFTNLRHGAGAETSDASRTASATSACTADAVIT